jgi:hypothetical protein
MVPLVSARMIRAKDLELKYSLTRTHSYSYVEAPEIHSYFNGCAHQWGCMKYIKLEHQVMEAR